mgnify:CR=1 FL=1
MRAIIVVGIYERLHTRVVVFITFFDVAPTGARFRPERGRGRIVVVVIVPNAVIDWTRFLRIRIIRTRLLRIPIVGVILGVPIVVTILSVPIVVTRRFLIFRILGFVIVVLDSFCHQPFLIPLNLIPFSSRCCLRCVHLVGIDVVVVV